MPVAARFASIQAVRDLLIAGGQRMQERAYAVGCRWSERGMHAVDAWSDHAKLPRRRNHTVHQDILAISEPLEGREHGL